MSKQWTYYDLPVGLYQGERLIGAAYFYVKARTADEAERKALAKAEEWRNPQLYGPTFELRIVRES